jgi:hypothetical protein
MAFKGANCVVVPVRSAMPSLSPRRIARCAASLALASGVVLLHLQSKALVPDGWIQKLRHLLGLQRPVAVGGSRSPSDQLQRLCVISPLTTKVIPQLHHGQLVSEIATAITPSGQPVIVTQKPLVEVLIYASPSLSTTDDKGPLIARWRADNDRHQARSISWPLQRELAPGETVVLELRPSGSQGGDFARLRLTRPAANSQKEASMTKAAGQLEVLFRHEQQGDASAKNQAQELIAAACRT